MTMTPTAPADDRPSGDLPADDDVARVIRAGEVVIVAQNASDFAEFAATNDAGAT